MKGFLVILDSHCSDAEIRRELWDAIGNLSSRRTKDVVLKISDEEAKEKADAFYKSQRSGDVAA